MFHVKGTSTRSFICWILQIFTLRVRSSCVVIRRLEVAKACKVLPMRSYCSEECCLVNTIKLYSSSTSHHKHHVPHIQINVDIPTIAFSTEHLLQNSHCWHRFQTAWHASPFKSRFGLKRSKSRLRMTKKNTFRLKETMCRVWTQYSGRQRCVWMILEAMPLCMLYPWMTQHSTKLLLSSKSLWMMLSQSGASITLRPSLRPKQRFGFLLPFFPFRFTFSAAITLNPLRFQRYLWWELGNPLSWDVNTK